MTHTGNKPRYTAAEVCAACEGTGGIKAMIARKLGCSRQTVVKYAKRYATVRKAIEDADQAMTDMAEGQHGVLVKEGYWPAIKYRLETKGRDRGYAPRLEVTGADGEPLTVNIIRQDGGNGDA